MRKREREIKSKREGEGERVRERKEEREGGRERVVSKSIEIQKMIVLTYNSWRSSRFRNPLRSRVVRLFPERSRRCSVPPL